MIEVSRDVQVPPDRVFAVLSDGWSLGNWVVGASHIRAVDAGWPAVGNRVYHSVGPWPVSVEDFTEVMDVEPGRRLELDAHLSVAGAAHVTIALAPLPGGATQITMAEEMVRGPGSLVPGVVQGVVLWPRNREALRRLEDMAVGRAGRSAA